MKMFHGLDLVMLHDPDTQLMVNSSYFILDKCTAQELIDGQARNLYEGYERFRSEIVEYCGFYFWRELNIPNGHERAVKIVDEDIKTYDDAIERCRKNMAVRFPRNQIQWEY